MHSRRLISQLINCPTKHKRVEALLALEHAVTRNIAEASKAFPEDVGLLLNYAVDHQRPLCAPLTQRIRLPSTRRGCVDRVQLPTQGAMATERRKNTAEVLGCRGVAK
jgi:hypothetical protein